MEIGSRIQRLEDQAAILRTKYAVCAIVDGFINGNESVAGLQGLLSTDYRWQCRLFESVQSLQGYKEFLIRYSKSISLSVHVLSNPIVDIHPARERADARWVVWQPFTWRESAWILAGRSEDRFVREDDAWRLAATRLEVEILSPWKEAWGTDSISKRWTWG
jgi:hypothetical protein